MKLTKIFAIALAALTMTACSDDDETIGWNSNADVTVEMGQATVSVKEGRGMVNVPITVTGEANGNIMVTVACEETGLTPAQEDVHYYVTDKTIIISPENTTASIELNVIDADEDINEARTFDIRIVDVTACKVGTLDYTSVTIRDNDGDYYDKMSGRWNVNYIDYDGNAATAQVVLSAADEDEAGYNEYYIMTGLMTYCSIQVDYFFDQSTMTGRFEIPYGQNVATVSFTGYGALPVYLMGLSGNYIIDEGSAVGNWSADLTTVEFPEEPEIGYMPYAASTGRFLLWDSQQILSFTR
ncbi:MAG: hypothetical protein K2L55_06115 [Muribaculaceae bacterium]|nr:hypothetical protein [Muribaculaceae bacterium]MDE6346227.1 hypothetical protein [Muribaculaceae bacterium]